MPYQGRTKTDVVSEFRRDEILDAAHRVFASQGFRDATVDHIAEAAGVAKGTVYLYFKSKDDLYWAALHRGLDRLHDAVVSVHRTWNRRVPTARLNQWLSGMIEAHPPPAPGGRRIRLRYITQAKTRQPGFVLSCSRPEAVPQSYIRYLVNSLRESFDMPGVPIRIVLRASENPFAGRAKKRG